MNTIKINNPNVKVIAHRGLSGLEKENTYPAFVAAGNRSYFGIETDIHVNHVGEFIVVHDENVKRVSNNKYSVNVEENPYSFLSNIVLPDVDGSVNRQDIRIPLLIDYIKICKKYEKIAVLELKRHFLKKDIRKLIKEISALDYLENVIFISFDFENCLNIRKLLPEQKVQFLLEQEITDDIIETLDKYRFDLDSYHRAITKDVVDKVHAKGLFVNCWTVNTPEDANRLIECGVDYITTNILE